MNSNPFVSIIIPAHNASQYLDRCLIAVAKSTYSSFELIVVDDGSIDDTAEIGRKNGAKVFKLQRQAGPAAARSWGSKKANGEILFFVDADVLIKPDTVERVVADLATHENISAVFGTYDDSPTAQNFISQYKNLQHHFVHQHSSREASTFWAGCGAIRREVFHRVGGFDQHRYEKPSIEDIELGYRMKKMGYRILLDKDLQVKHLKQWSLLTLLRADIFYRAVPWSKLIIKSGEMIDDLNLQLSAKISAILIGLSVGLLPVILFKPQLIYLILVFLLIIIILNYKFYKFLSNRNGILFSVSTFPLHLLYYFYSGLIFGFFQVRHIFSEKNLSEIDV